MNLTVVNVVTALFLVNALFWGLGSHSQHCEIAKIFGIKCIQHNYHLTMGVVFFLATVTLVHRKHLSQYVPLLKKLN
jgi:hypothetical protein